MAPGDKSPRDKTSRGLNAGVDPSSTPSKRPWQQPRVLTGHLFESNSLSCGKSTPGLDQCNQNPVNS